MSTDYVAVCHQCKVKIHAGQRMANAYSFGYGSADSDGRKKVAAWVFQHAWHGKGVQIIPADSIEDPGYPKPGWAE